MSRTATKPAASRHRPVAHGADARGGKSEGPKTAPKHEERRVSETRLVAVVAPRRPRDEDLYEDVPCTD